MNQSANGGERLADVLAEVTQPCLSWLDGHYSDGNTAKTVVETSIVGELRLILEHHVLRHVLLVDDARKFTGLNGRPTLDSLRALIFSKHPEWVFQVVDDITRIHERKTAR